MTFSMADRASTPRHSPPRRAACSSTLASQAATDGVDSDALSSIENAIGSAFDDIIVSSDAANEMDAGDGNDTVSYDLSARGQLINLASGAATDGLFTDTLRSIENAAGSGFDDIIVSSDAANRIDGRGGSDTVSYDLSVRGQLINLAGGAATDGVFTDALLSIENAIGSAFDDIIVSSDAANRIDGRGGSDTVSYDLSARGQLINLAGGAATDGVATDTLLSIENAIGSELSDVMHGNALDNILDGGAGGSDQINGADGSDTASYASRAAACSSIWRRRRRSTGSTPTRCPRSRTPPARASTTSS